MNEFIGVLRKIQKVMYLLIQFHQGLIELSSSLTHRHGMFN